MKRQSLPTRRLRHALAAAVLAALPFAGGESPPAGLATLAGVAHAQAPARGQTRPAAAQAPALPPGVLRDCPACPELAVVPAGTFVLGTSADARERDAERGESPPLPVLMQRPYAIGRHEVTVGQWRAFLAATQYPTTGNCRIASGGAWLTLRDRDWTNPGFPQGSDDEPVVCVSWDDARAYVDWLSQLTGQRYRLPSETEWEYAARGGTTSARYWGTDSDEDSPVSLACEHGNVYDASAIVELAFPYPNARCSDRLSYTAVVGRFRPNAFDLHDMIGNVREWLQDCYTASYQGRPPDGRAWEWAGGCELRGVRGGSWATRPAESRAAARDFEPHGTRQSDLGFRVARDL